ncbi:hypothetical protein M440DRAFT_1442448 [Trichoderma longibrachiatum ATCC 18648]|uniref:Uncharacterized protein n=1 Tax=Trichoderma longibrachiatum ATCC 18648 TaxID=983965 RepID=A0A2T4BR35_TRILO|nr:hypothetical protein M440DRAFT_1442448 [Trichoderma longibrachiatum ATCC 18648]
MSSRIGAGVSIIPYDESKELQPSQPPEESSANDAVPRTRTSHKPLEFVTVSPAKGKDGKDISKVVRTQVMKDYFWKRRNLEKPDQKPTDQPTSLSQYKGRFRLNAQPNKSKPKPISRKSKGRDRGRDRASSDVAGRAQKGRIVMPRGPIADPSTYDPDGFFASTPVGLLGGSLDPFDSFALNLKPESLKLIYYYKQSYSRDSLHLNVGGGYCLFDAREHHALFHSILYLVALDFNLRRGFTDTIGCLYHSSEAFRLINEKIRDDIIEDATMAAIALVAIKEFPYTPISAVIKDTSFSHGPSEPAETFSLQIPLNLEQQLTSLVESLRKSSAAKDANAHKNEASHVYDVEYRLHLLQAGVFNLQYASKDMAAVCVALNIYLYLAIRELPAKAQLMWRLIDRLQASFRVEWAEPMTSSEQWKQEWKLWTLFIGYGAALDNGRQEWFVRALKSAYNDAGYQDMEHLHDTLKNLLWQESWCEHYFNKLREELAR